MKPILSWAGTLTKVGESLNRLMGTAIFRVPGLGLLDFNKVIRPFPLRFSY